MEFECMKWSCGKGRKMEEQAKEELQMLEAQYPNRFEFLKLELKSYIFLLQSQQQQQQDSQLDSENNNHCNNFLSFMIDTEESTSLEQRKSSSKQSFEPALEDRVVMERKIDEGSENESLETDSIKYCSGRKSKRRDRVDMVLERAEACLKKIRHFKTSLLSPS